MRGWAQFERDLDLLGQGGRLSSGEVGALERFVARREKARPSRVRLLGHYLPRRKEPEARERWLAHLVWLVEHDPACRLAGSPYCQVLPRLDRAAYRRVSRVWNRIVASPRTPVDVLRSAADFFTSADVRRSVALCRRLRALEPGRFEWAQRLGHKLELMDRWREAFATYREALRLGAGPTERVHLVVYVARAALLAGELDDARSYAEEALASARRHYSPREARRDAHGLLGRVALAKGDVKTASRELHATIPRPLDPDRRGFGEDMELANALLAHGEREVVLAYLRKANRNRDWPGVTEWIAAIVRGETPRLSRFRARTAGGG